MYHSLFCGLPTVLNIVSCFLFRPFQADDPDFVGTVERFSSQLETYGGPGSHTETSTRLVRLCGGEREEPREIILDVNNGQGLYCSQLGHAFKLIIVQCADSHNWSANVDAFK